MSFQLATLEEQAIIHLWVSHPLIIRPHTTIFFLFLNAFLCDFFSKLKPNNGIYIYNFYIYVLCTIACIIRFIPEIYLFIFVTLSVFALS